MRSVRGAVLGLLAVAAVGCGGGGNPSLVARAGADLNALPGSTVMLDGSGSSDADGRELTYSWTQTAGTSVVLTGQGTARPTFTAPTTPGVLTFSLTVLVGQLPSAPDEVTVTVSTTPPGNRPPVANAGADKSPYRRQTVTLSGSGSDPDWNTVSFNWSQLSGTPVTVANPSVSSISFTAPDTVGDLTFQLAVFDGYVISTDTVVVHVLNRAPTLTDPTLTPSVARTLDDLTIATTGTDQDGDTLTTTYAWKRDGVVIAGQTAAVLPDEETAKGQVITAVVSVSDGVDVTSKEVGLTIQDTPPAISVSGAPAQTAVCGAVAFNASAVDVDGDPTGPFELLHGPSGMTVATGGAVSWDGCLPMFDTSLTVNWGIGLADHPAAILTGTIEVQDAARPYVLRRTGLSAPGGQNAIRVANLDGAGTEEVLLASSRSLQVLSKTATAYAQSWVYPFSPPDGRTYLAVAAGDLDADGKQELFASTAGYVIRLDGVNRRETGRYATSGYGCYVLELADLSGDGDLELVCLGMSASYSGTNDRVVVFDAATLTIEWQTAQADYGTSLAIGNVDGDAALEVVTSKGYVFNGAEGTNQWTYALGFGTRVDTGDVDGAAPEEVIAVNGTKIIGYDALNKSPIWEFTAANSKTTLLVTDFEGDAKAEILTGESSTVVGYNYSGGAGVLSVAFTISAQSSSVSALGAGELDGTGDGKKELIWGLTSALGSTNLVVAGRSPSNMTIEWTNTNPNEMDGHFVGGELARLTTTPSSALLFATATTNQGYDGTRLVTLNPATGEWKASAELGSNWDAAVGLKVADYDNDGVDEAFLGTAEVRDGYFTAYNFATATAEWTSAVGQGLSAAVTSGDANADGFADLIALATASYTSDGYIHVWDVKGQALLWKSTSIGNSVDVEFADLDGDGTGEIVALTATGLYVYKKSVAGMSYLQQAVKAFTGGRDLVVGDLDADGVSEIHLLTMSGSYPYNGTVKRYDATLTELGSFALPTTQVSSLHEERLGSGRRNVLVSIGEDSPYSAATLLPQLRAYDPFSGNEVWRSPPLDGLVSRNSLHYRDLAGSSVPEVSFGTTAGMNVTR